MVLVSFSDVVRIVLGPFGDGVGIVSRSFGDRFSTIWGSSWDRPGIVSGSCFFFVCERVCVGGSLLSADSGELSIFFSWEVPCPPGCFSILVIVLSSGNRPALGVV